MLIKPPRKFRLPMLGNRTATTSGPRPAPTTMASAVPAAGAMNGCFVFEDGDSTSNNSDSTSKNWALDQQKWIEMGEFKRQKPQIQPAKHRIRGVKHGDNGNWTSYQCGFDQQKWSPKIRGSGHSTRTWSKLHPQVPGDQLLFAGCQFVLMGRAPMRECRPRNGAKHGGTRVPPNPPCSWGFYMKQTIQLLGWFLHETNHPAIGVCFISHSSCKHLWIASSYCTYLPTGAISSPRW